MSSGRILRYVSDSGSADWRAYVESGLRTELESAGLVARTQELAVSEVPVDLDPERPGEVRHLLEHEAVPFISYPYEWPFEMHRAAALLHLEVLERALARGLTTRDGSAYNVQFRGTRPVFIDVLSFSPLRHGELWHGHKQFRDHFLNPLLFASRAGIGPQTWLRGRQEGMDEATLGALMGPRVLFDRQLLTAVVLPRLAARLRIDHGLRRDLETTRTDTREILRNVFRSLRRSIETLRAPRADPRSPWVGYASQECHYAPKDRMEKHRFVEEALRRCRPATVWDLGTNTGEYARVAARSGSYVIAIDSDEIAVDALYRGVSKERGLTECVLPLVVDIVDPSPDQGWLLRERGSLEARGRPDMVIALALIHHIVLGRSVPHRAFVDHLAGMGRWSVFEFVGKQDPKAQDLLASKADRYDDYDQLTFERYLLRRTTILERTTLPISGRTLYLAERTA